MPDSYKLRGYVAAALSANRVELLTMEIASVRTGEAVYTANDVIELLRLIKELIEDRETKRQRDADFENEVRSAISNIVGAARKVETELHRFVAEGQ